MISAARCIRCDRALTVPASEPADDLVCAGCLQPREDIEESLAFAARVRAAGVATATAEGESAGLSYALSTIDNLRRRLASLDEAREILDRS